MKESNNSSGGIGFLGLLAIVFIVLKLIDKIDWSWWWVLSPLWIPFSIILVLLLAWGVFALIGSFHKPKTTEIKKSMSRFQERLEQKLNEQKK